MTIYAEKATVELVVTDTMRRLCTLYLAETGRITHIKRFLIEKNGPLLMRTLFLEESQLIHDVIKITVNGQYYEGRDHTQLKDLGVTNGTIS